MRKWIVALAVLMVVPAVGAAASIVIPPKTEQLVEGHTVFTVLEVRRNTTVEEYAAAVAVLVRDIHSTYSANRFPGVLWFNDQYLVDPVDSSSSNVDVRYPCTGAVIARNAGATDPRTHTYLPTEYVESYLITDPNDHTWNIDLWNFNAGTLLPPDYAWTVSIMNNDAGRGTPDDGACRGTVWTDATCGPNAQDMLSGTLHCATANGQYCDPQGLTSSDCPDLQYNAVLYFRLQHLTVPGMNKDHSAGSTNRTQDVSGCSDSASNVFIPSVSYWPCPARDDNREGNSHDYNPTGSLPVVPNGAGRGNHGGSADCGTDGLADQFCHATRNVDIYYGTAGLPVARTNVVFDLVGSADPYHCESSVQMCGIEGLDPPNAQDYYANTDEW